LLKTSFILIQDHLLYTTTEIESKRHNCSSSYLVIIDGIQLGLRYLGII